MSIAIQVLKPADKLRECASCGILHDIFDLDWDDMCEPCIEDDAELAEYYIQRVRDYRDSVL